ncbi:MAG TPA: hydroxymethylbilane synthase [Candidatus Dormibacteraeota bacterium]
MRLGTRASRLATTQSGAFGALLRDATGRDVELVEVTTQGDVSAEPLDRMGATGVFVTALREALLDGRIDLAVHSYKDLPTAAVPGLAVGAVPPREDPRDALVARGGAALATLPAGARVGTGSPRRAAQLRALGLPLLVVPIRGNVDTRVRLVERGAVDAIVVARAGLARLGRLDLVTETLPTDVLLPAPAQGALAVECRADDAELLALLGALDHAPSRAVVEAERALLATLEGGCSAPVAALARRVDDGLALEAAVAPPDGSRLLRMSASGSLAEPARLGEELAAALLDAGAGALVRAARRLDER